METQCNPRYVAIMEMISRTAAFVVIILGLLVMAGWTFDVDILKQGSFDTRNTMTANTAVGFVSTGLAVLLLRRGRGSASVLFAFVAAFLGALTLGEHLLGWNAGIDELFINDPRPASANYVPGRMSLLSALNFTLVGLALLIGGKREGLRICIAQVLIALHGILTVFAILDLVLVPAVPYTSLTIHGVLGHFLVFVSAMLRWPAAGLMRLVASETLGGVIARQLLPLALVIPLLLGWAKWQLDELELLPRWFSVSLLVTATVVLLVVFIWLAALSLQKSDVQRRQAEADLQKARDELRQHASELEKRVTERTSELQASVTALERLLYSIAHDLRAPLRAMSGFSQALLEDHAPKLDESGRDYLNRINVAARRMDALIIDLLGYGRLNYVPLPLQTVATGEVVRQVLRELTSEMKSRGAEVQIEGTCSAVYANETLLTQVIRNILSNALKFIAPGMKPHIHIWCEEKRESIRLLVKDNGIGIAPEHQGKIFNIFEQLHGYDTFSGTGIGLPIVAKGVERMHGNVGVISEPGKGSTFWIELPKALQPAELVTA